MTLQRSYCQRVTTSRPSSSSRGQGMNALPESTQTAGTFANNSEPSQMESSTLRPTEPAPALLAHSSSSSTRPSSSVRSTTLSSVSPPLRTQRRGPPASQPRLVEAARMLFTLGSPQAFLGTPASCFLVWAIVNAALIAHSPSRSVAPGAHFCAVWRRSSQNSSSTTLGEQGHEERPGSAQKAPLTISTRAEIPTYVDSAHAPKNTVPATHSTNNTTGTGNSRNHSRAGPASPNSLDTGGAALLGSVLGSVLVGSVLDFVVASLVRIPH